MDGKETAKDFLSRAEKSEKLENGAQMISFAAPALNTAAFSVVLPFVPEGRAGSYHCVEHLFFERAGQKRAPEINAEMTSRGSEIMGYTTRNYMCFNFSCRKEVFADQLALLYSMLTQKEYGEEEEQSVLDVISNEIFEYDFYDNRTADILRESWYDGRFTKSVLGTAEDLDSFTEEEIAEARESLFTDGMAVFAAGALSERDLQTVRGTFGKIPLRHYGYVPEYGKKQARKKIEKRGRGRDLQVLVTYHLEGANVGDQFAAYWLKSALFDGMDAAFLRFFDRNGFHFYSVDGSYSVLGDEIVFSFSTYIKRKEKKRFLALLDEFEREAEKTPFLKLVRPFLYDNGVFLYDNPERLCSHYTESWADLSRPVTLKEERGIASRFTDGQLARLWRRFAGSERKIYFLA